MCACLHSLCPADETEGLLFCYAVKSSAKKIASGEKPLSLSSLVYPQQNYYCRSHRLFQLHITFNEKISKEASDQQQKLRPICCSSSAKRQNFVHVFLVDRQSQSSIFIQMMSQSLCLLITCFYLFAFLFTKADLSIAKCVVFTPQ